MLIGQILESMLFTCRNRKCLLLSCARCLQGAFDPAAAGEKSEDVLCSVWFYHMTKSQVAKHCVQVCVLIMLSDTVLDLHGESSSFIDVSLSL